MAHHRSSASAQIQRPEDYRSGQEHVRRPPAASATPRPGRTAAVRCCSRYGAFRAGKGLLRRCGLLLDGRRLCRRTRRGGCGCGRSLHRAWRDTHQNDRQSPRRFESRRPRALLGEPPAAPRGSRAGKGGDVAVAARHGGSADLGRVRRLYRHGIRPKRGGPSRDAPETSLSGGEKLARVLEELCTRFAPTVAPGEGEEVSASKGNG